MQVLRLRIPSSGAATANTHPTIQALVTGGMELKKSAGPLLGPCRTLDIWKIPQDQSLQRSSSLRFWRCTRRDRIGSEDLLTELHPTCRAGDPAWPCAEHKSGRVLWNKWKLVANHKKLPYLSASASFSFAEFCPFAA